MSETLRSPGDTLNPLLKASLHGLGLAISVSLILFTFERAVIPIYSSVPTRLYLTHFTLISLALPHIQPFAKLRTILRWKWFLVGLALALAPNATYWTSRWTARSLKDPYLGPLALHAAVFVPLVSALANCTVSHRDTPKVAHSLTGIVASFAAYPVSIYLARVLARQPVLFAVTDSQILLTLSGLAFMVGIIEIDFTRTSAPVVSSKNTKTQKKKRVSSSKYSIPPIAEKIGALVCLGILFLSYGYKLHAPVRPDPLFTVGLPKPDADGIRVQILSSVQSTTGLIVVGEAMTPPRQDLEAYEQEGVLHSLRYLRAAHSLLGGVWYGPRAMTLSENDTPVRDSRGVVLGDSIYGVFVLQEAARLVNSTQKAPENVLIIGLGTGTAATAFHRHDLDVSIVEIDPAVYDAAVKFFGLPDIESDNVYLEDARGWAARKRNEIQKSADQNHTLYDIVVHDCFSGGGIPEKLFAVEFLEDLKSVMQPEGVIAVNFAGYAISEASRLILRTLEKVFGAPCKAFFDSTSLLNQTQLEEEFMNIVFFCTLSPEPISFRPAIMGDILGSPLRKHMLGTLHSREIDLSLLRDGDEQDKANGLPDVLLDGNNPLGKMQEAKAHHHWELMRKVLPTVFWETY